MRAEPVGVLMLTKGLGLGGTERLIAGTVRYLDPARFRPEVAYLLPWKDALVGDIRGDGIPVECLDGPRPGSVGWIGRLRRLVREHDIGIVHTHMPQPAVGARVGLGRGGPVLVHTEHNVWERYRPLTRWANRATYRRNRVVIAVSGGVAASIRSGVRVDVVRHGVDPAAAINGDGVAGRVRLGLGGGPVVGTVGNLTAKKDHATLLTALELARREVPDLRLVVVGAGPLEGELHQRIAARGLEDAVVMTGSRTDVPDLIAAFDVFALSSRFEGLPIALLEAMAAGRPCVATTVGGIPEVITDGSDGLLVPPGDPAAIAAAIVEVLADRDRASELGRRAVARAAAFDLPAAVRHIERLYDEVLGPC